MADGGRIIVETANCYMDERTGRKHQVPPGQYVLISVSDSGSGMPAEVIQRIFEPFFTTKPEGVGTGLGLSMVHRFVRQSGGQVRVYSELGAGTTFKIYLPRYAGAFIADGIPDVQDELKPSERHETVLIVDDESTIRMLVTEVLEDFGYRGIEAVDGASAMAVLRSDRRVDLLITDVGLPGGVSGRQVADGARVLRPDLKVCTSPDMRTMP